MPAGIIIVTCIRVLGVGEVKNEQPIKLTSKGSLCSSIWEVYCGKFYTGEKKRLLQRPRDRKLMGIP